MKFLMTILTYSVACAVVVTCAPHHHETSDNGDFHETLDLCAAEMGILFEEAERSFEMPIMTPGNCIMACVWKKVGLMESTGKINKQEMIDSITAYEKMQSDTFHNHDYFYDCVDDANEADNECAVISEYFKCLVKDLLIEYE